MAALTWSDGLALQQPRMDRTHREFVDLLAAVEARRDAPAAALVPALAEWFPIHAGSMDAGLAQAMQDCGFDPETGEMDKPSAEAEPATGCGSTHCG
ncbi:MAG: hypothetical protein C0505_18485 [Leptothrix sp. (in: Bacteria)]|nr:hypothetical protein [Leptothrix sp. (in: b-proteobacteria)]